ncbi:hypothetical protein SAMN05428963_104161 [Consotaella salsifontis]|uniref:Uncharacterized protein n=1 Tax=Consotaella salsifontis TaxID=1365950 RepID=A0A1T4PUP6_9HYPH|nr:hypothetical protein SAMN05428963_104161 [Consotaella salsifontis]
MPAGGSMLRLTPPVVVTVTTPGVPPGFFELRLCIVELAVIVPLELTTVSVHAAPTVPLKVIVPVAANAEDEKRDAATARCADTDLSKNYSAEYE